MTVLPISDTSGELPDRFSSGQRISKRDYLYMNQTVGSLPRAGETQEGQQLADTLLGKLSAARSSASPPRKAAEALPLFMLPALSKRQLASKADALVEQALSIETGRFASNQSAWRYTGQSHLEVHSAVNSDVRKQIQEAAMLTASMPWKSPRDESEVASVLASIAAGTTPRASQQPSNATSKHPSKPSTPRAEDGSRASKLSSIASKEPSKPGTPRDGQGSRGSRPSAPPPASADSSTDEIDDRRWVAMRASVVTPAATAAAARAAMLAAGTRSFACVLGAERLSLASRAALGRPAALSTTLAPAALSTTLEPVASPRSDAALLGAMRTLQRTAVAAEGATVLLMACLQAQSLINATDVCLLLWRSPSATDGPTVLRPSEPDTAPHRNACAALYGDQTALRLLGRAAAGAHLLSLCAQDDASPAGAAVPAAGAPGSVEFTGVVPSAPGSVELSGVVLSAPGSVEVAAALTNAAVPLSTTLPLSVLNRFAMSLRRALAIPLPLPFPHGPALMLLADGARIPAARAPGAPTTAPDPPAAASAPAAPPVAPYTVEEQLEIQTLVTAAAAIFPHARSQPPDAPTAAPASALSTARSTADGPGAARSPRRSPRSHVPTHHVAHSHPPFGRMRPVRAAAGGPLASAGSAAFGSTADFVTSTASGGSAKFGASVGASAATHRGSPREIGSMRFAGGWPGSSPFGRSSPSRSVTASAVVTAGLATAFPAFPAFPTFPAFPITALDEPVFFRSPSAGATSPRHAGVSLHPSGAPSWRLPSTPPHPPALGTALGAPSSSPMKPGTPHELGPSHEPSKPSTPRSEVGANGAPGRPPSRGRKAGQPGRTEQMEVAAQTDAVHFADSFSSFASFGARTYPPLLGSPLAASADAASIAWARSRLLGGGGHRAYPY